jgi:copper/silver efflux system protein
VMKRIGAPMIGGMVTSTLLTLLVIPAVYSLWREREVGRSEVRLSGVRSPGSGVRNDLGMHRRPDVVPG